MFFKTNWNERTFTIHLIYLCLCLYIYVYKFVWDSLFLPAECILVWHACSSNVSNSFGCTGTWTMCSLWVEAWTNPLVLLGLSQLHMIQVFFTVFLILSPWSPPPPKKKKNPKLLMIISMRFFLSLLEYMKGFFLCFLCFLCSIWVERELTIWSPCLHRLEFCALCSTSAHTVYESFSFRSLFHCH